MATIKITLINTDKSLTCIETLSLQEKRKRLAHPPHLEGLGAGARQLSQFKDQYFLILQKAETPWQPFNSFLRPAISNKYLSG
jgi:hypothetical protein